MPLYIKSLRSIQGHSGACSRESNRVLVTRAAKPCLVLLFFVLLAPFFSPAAAQNQNDLKRAQAFYEKALQEKKPAARIELLQKAAQLCDGNAATALPPASQRQVATIYWALGREFFQQAKWQAAILHLEKAVAADSTLYAAHTTLGLIYFQQRRYEAAIATYKKVLVTQPAAQLYNNLGAAYEAKGDWRAALESYQHALAMDANLTLAQKNLRRVQEKLALANPVAPAGAPTAAVDSARLAAQRHDSLAALTKKSARNTNKIKPKMEKAPDARNPITAKNTRATEKSPDKKNPPAVKPRPESVWAAQNLRPAKAAKDTAHNMSSSASPAASQKKKTTAADLKPQLPTPSSSAQMASDSIKIPADDFSGAAAGQKMLAEQINLSVATSLPPPARTAVTPRANSSNHSNIAYLCGAGVVLCGILIYTQRRRLGRVWLQFRPALASPNVGVIPEERLLPAGVARHAVNANDTGTQLKLLPSRTAAAVATADFAPVETNEHAEARQPSLQTQAFFAEMIAAEPEIEEFEESRAESSVALEAELKPTAADVAVSPAMSSPLPDAKEEERQAIELLAPTSPVAPTLTLNGKNGPVSLPQLESESASAPATSEALIEISSTSQKVTIVEASPNTEESPLPFDNEPATPSPRNEQETATSPQPVNSDKAERHENLALAGQPTLGRYLIEREIGKGAMGKIYLAFDPKLDRRVVIKTVCFNLATSETDTAVLKDRVYREARAIAKLGHPNIVVVYDVEDDKDLSYIVMEHIEGRDLRQALKSERRFEYQRAIKIMAQVCSALDYAHQAGIVHRDIKPSNIMLLPDDKAKVTDFGIAKIADNFSLTLPGHVLGTPSYMAPEQLEGEALDGRADIFSLGVVFYELLTGGRPFAGDSLAALAYKIVHKMHIPPSLQNVELPLELDEIVSRALAKQPEERYQTAEEFREALLKVT